MGGFFAQAAGLGAPFYLLGALAVTDAALLVYMRPSLPTTAIRPPPDEESAPEIGAAVHPTRKALWRNPSALIVAATIACGNLATSLTEPLAPIWLGNGPLQYGPGLQATWRKVNVRSTT